MRPKPDTSFRQASVAVLIDSSHTSQDKLLATGLRVTFQCMEVRNHMKSKPDTSSVTRNIFPRVLSESGTG